MRILGLDVGSRRIGIAISDAEGIIAIPLTVIEHEDEEGVLECISSLILEEGVSHIVVGMPRSLDGSLGMQAKEVEDFICRLSQQIEIPIETWDERLSTVTAHKMMVDAGTKKSQRKKKIDAIAATVILQGYLDRTQYAINH